MTTDVRDDITLTLTTTITRLQKQLCDMAQDLANIHQHLSNGSLEILGESRQFATDLRQWLKIAMEAEKDLEERQRKTAHPGTFDCLDLDAARLSIGRRLDRLRRAAEAGGVSGEPE